jgi:hypothetical protein
MQYLNEVLKNFNIPTVDHKTFELKPFEPHTFKALNRVIVPKTFLS